MALLASSSWSKFLIHSQRQIAENRFRSTGLRNKERERDSFDCFQDIPLGRVPPYIEGDFIRGSSLPTTSKKELGAK